MKRSKYPRLRTHTRKGQSGQVWTWWAYDMRPDGGTEISLGNDYAKALEQWHKLHNHIPMTKGRIQPTFLRDRLASSGQMRSQSSGRSAFLVTLE